MIASKKPKGANSTNTKEQHKTKKSEEEITKNVKNKARNKNQKHTTGRHGTKQEELTKTSRSTQTI